MQRNNTHRSTIFLIISFIILSERAVPGEVIPIELKWLQMAFIAETREQKDKVFSELADRLTIFEIPLAGTGDYVNFNDLPSANRDFTLKNYDIEGDASSEYIFIANYSDKPESRLKYYLTMVIKETFDKRLVAVYCDIDLLSSVKADVNLKTPGLKYFYINKFRDEGNGIIDSRFTYFELKDMKLSPVFSYIDYRKGSSGPVNFEAIASKTRVAGGVLTIVYNYNFTPIRDSLLKFDYFDELQEKYPAMEEQLQLVQGSDSLMYILNDPQLINKPFYYEVTAKGRISFIEGRSEKSFSELFNSELEKIINGEGERLKRDLARFTLNSKPGK